MGQGDVLKILKDGNLRTARQIANELNCSYKSVNTSARRLWEWGEIIKEKIKLDNYWVNVYGIAWK